MFHRVSSWLYARCGWIPGIALICLGAIGPALADETRLHSGPERTLMIELYTSEGCSSCPPAEKYLNSFVAHPRLWTTYVPLAFHVDYWDYLGWKDRFARPDNAQRQRLYAQRASARTVYTPDFVVNGEHWRPGLFRRDPDPQVSGRGDGADGNAGELSVTVRDGRFMANYTPANIGKPPLVFHIAVLGMGLTSDIQTGENRGRESRHEFVVLSHQRVSGTGLAWNGTLPDIADFAAPAYSLAAWVSRSDDPTPLQAAGGRYLP